MNNFRLELEAYGGANIRDCCIRAVHVATILGVNVVFKHNGVKMVAHPNSDPLELYKMWRRKKPNDNYVTINRSSQLSYPKE